MQKQVRTILQSPTFPVYVGFLLFTAFLFFGHYVMSYSDPNHWIQRAEAMADGTPKSRRVLLFPLYLILWLKVAGPDWIFLANLPLLVGLMYGLGSWANLLLSEEKRPKNFEWTLSMLFTLVLGYFAFRGLFLRIQNPYREAGALLLLVMGATAYFKSDKEANPLQGFLAGLYCFLSMGFRETTIVSMLPILFWTLYRLIREYKNPKRWRWIGTLTLGTFLGVSPFLIQNWIYSGNPFVPAYSAGHVLQPVDQQENIEGKGTEANFVDGVEVKAKLRWHRLIPGMEPRNFDRIFPKTLRRVRSIAGPVGVGAFLIGLVFGIIRKNRLIYGFLVPAAALNALFYGFYRYVNNRYIIIIPLLLLPVAAYGLTMLTNLLIQKFASEKEAKVSSRICWSLLVLLLAGIIHFKILEPPKLKIWHMATFRESLDPYLEEPREFLGYYHHREMLAWVMDQDFNHHHIGSEIDAHVLEENGLDGALKLLKADMFSRMSEKALYFHHEQHTPSLTPLWFKTEPIVDLSTLPATLYHYGLPLEFKLHRIVPWDNEAIRASLKVSSDPTPKVLYINGRRIWDDDRRETAFLSVDGVQYTDKLPNDVSFWEIESEASTDGELDVLITGNLPLPDYMPMKTWEQNQELYLNLGKQPEWWFHTLLDNNIKFNAPLRGDASMMFEAGGLTLPHFASEDRVTFAEFRLEFYQEDPYFKTQRETFTDGHRVWPLPTRRTQSRATFHLGRGTGHLEWTKLNLVSSLPSFDDQHQMGHDLLIADHGFLKFFDVVLFTIPAAHTEERDIIVGSSTSGAYIRNGFFWKEKHKGRYPVRWTSPQATMDIPALRPDHPMQLDIRFFDHVKEGSSTVSLLWNGEPVEMSVSKEDEQPVLQATLPPERFLENGLQELVLTSPAWSPADLHDSPDKRELGIMLHRVTLTPLPNATTP